MTAITPSCRLQKHKRRQRSLRGFPRIRSRQRELFSFGKFPAGRPANAFVGCLCRAAGCFRPQYAAVSVDGPKRQHSVRSCGAIAQFEEAVDGTTLVVGLVRALTLPASGLSSIFSDLLAGCPGPYGSIRAAANQESGAIRKYLETEDHAVAIRTDFRYTAPGRWSTVSLSESMANTRRFGPGRDSCAPGGSARQSQDTSRTRPSRCARSNSACVTACGAPGTGGSKSARTPDSPDCG